MTIINAITKICKKTDFGAQFTLPPDFPAFDGHFPDMPVLPAVVQVQMAVHAISPGAKLKEVKKAKFAAPVTAGDTISLFITPRDGFYDVVIKKAESTVSSFQIII